MGMRDRMDEFIISSKELESELDSYYVLDVRKKDEYECGHISGAYHLPIDYWLKQNNEFGIARGEGIIEPDQFKSLMDSMGINNSTKLVVYDNNSGRGASRFWWVARYYGMESVRVLDGGWSAWIKIGGMTDVTTRDFRYGNDYIIRINRSLLTEIDEVISSENSVIIDARSDDEWFCRDSHNNPRMGHIPKAIHLEWNNFLKNQNGISYLCSVSHIRSLMKKNGITKKRKIITYCQAGVRASVVAFALLYAGYSNVSVYDGSMYEWSRKLELPLVREEV